MSDLATKLTREVAERKRSRYGGHWLQRRRYWLFDSEGKIGDYHYGFVQRPTAERKAELLNKGLLDAREEVILRMPDEVRAIEDAREEVEKSEQQLRDAEGELDRLLMARSNRAIG